MQQNKTYVHVCAYRYAAIAASIICIIYYIHIQIITARVKSNFKIIKLLSISCKLGSNVVLHTNHHGMQHCGAVNSVLTEKVILKPHKNGVEKSIIMTAAMLG